jgi:mRNA interferase MazF
VAVVKRFDLYLVNIDEQVSNDAKNTRPCVVISPDEMNVNLSHVLIAPISSGSTAYPTRVPVDILNSRRYIILDQIRTVDADRLVKKIGELDKPTQKITLDTLQEFFAE